MSDPSSVSGLISTTPKDSSVDENKIASSLVASQAEQEAASVTNKMVSPGRQHYHPGMVKAWVEFDGTGTVSIKASYNIDSITDNSTGDYTVNWDTDFSGADYACVVSSDNFYRRTLASLTTNQVRILTYNSSQNVTDDAQISVIACGDHA